MSGATKTVAARKVLELAAAYAERGWTQGWYARDSCGVATSACEPQAVSWCIHGALSVAGGGEYDAPERAALHAVLGTSNLSHWNDQPERTQAEVVAALRAAAQDWRVCPPDLCELPDHPGSEGGGNREHLSSAKAAPAADPEDDDEGVQ